MKSELKAEINSSKNEVISHFNMVAEQIQSNLSSINEDESLVVNEKLLDHEKRILKLETS